MRALITIAALGLSGCVLGPTSPEAAKVASTEDLCESWGKFENETAFTEVRQRGVLTVDERTAVRKHSLFVGMSRIAVICSWGRPSEVNTTTLADAQVQQWVYETYYGRSVGSSYSFVYLEADKVTAIQN